MEIIFLRCVRAGMWCNFGMLSCEIFYYFSHHFDTKQLTTKWGKSECSMFVTVVHTPFQLTLCLVECSNYNNTPKSSVSEIFIIFLLKIYHF